MKIELISGEDAIPQAMKRVEIFLDDAEARVFQILGYYGIGKRTALSKLFERRGIVPENHNYTVIDYAEPIERRIKDKPDSVHLWADVFRSNITNKSVFRFFHDLSSGRIPFNGKFILVANDKEFPRYKFPDLPGVHIRMSNAEMLAYIRQSLQIGEEISDT